MKQVAVSAFTPLESLLRHNQIVDINADPIPLQNISRLVAKRLRSGFSPAIAAVGAHLPILPNVRNACGEGVISRLSSRRNIVRVDDTERG